MYMAKCMQCTDFTYAMISTTVYCFLYVIVTQRMMLDGRRGRYDRVVMIWKRVHRWNDVEMFVHPCSATRMCPDLLPPIEFRFPEWRGVGDGPRDHVDGDRKTGELVVLDLC